MQRLTLEQAVVLSAYTGMLLCPFDKMHAEIERRYGHPVFTHQLGDAGFLNHTVKPLFEEDFHSILPVECQQEDGE